MAWLLAPPLRPRRAGPVSISFRSCSDPHRNRSSWLGRASPVLGRITPARRGVRWQRGDERVES